MELKEYRESIGITEKDAADALGIHPRYYKRLEVGYTDRPSPELAIRIETWSNGKVERFTLRPDIWSASN